MYISEFFRIRWIVTYLVIFCTQSVFAQSGETIEIADADSNAVYYFINKLGISDQLSLKFIDTSLTDFQRYNPLYPSIPFHASLGNVGLAYRNLDFDYLPETGFDYGIHTFDAYFFSNNNVRYFDNPRPYSEISYVIGAKKEQLLKVLFDQMVYKGLTLGIDYHLINSLGAYKRQKSDHSNVVFKAHYFTPNKRYGFVFNYMYNRIKVRENGGILYDSIFENDVETNRSIIPVKLYDAENILRKSGIFLQQYFQLSKSDKVRKNDTVPEKEKIRFKFGRIAHSFNYKRNSQIYIDGLPDTLYYPHIYKDTLSTYDSVFYKKIENTLSWSSANYLNINHDPAVKLLLGIKQQYIEIAEGDGKNSFNSFIPYGSLSIRPHPNLKLKCNASYILTGEYNQGDFDISAAVIQNILKKSLLKPELIISLNINKNTPPWFYRHYYSNHFRWDNHFKKINSGRLGISLKVLNTKAGVEICRLNNYVFIATDTLAAQFDQGIEIFKAFLNSRFRIGKFDIDGKFVYQKVSDDNILRLPAFMANFTFYFNWVLFKGALKTKSGLDVFYNTKYYANAYMPVLRSFYLQNETEVGNFFYVDIFLNFSVKRTLFFLKFQNLISLFGIRNYYMTPHYPMQDIAFKFGISWRFHD